MLNSETEGVRVPVGVCDATSSRPIETSTTARLPAGRTADRLLGPAVLALALLLVVGACLSPAIWPRPDRWASASASAAAPAAPSGPVQAAVDERAARGARVMSLRALQSGTVDAASPRRSSPRDRLLGLDRARRTTYLKFDRSALAGRRIVRASLKLRVVDVSGVRTRVVAKPASGKWTAGALTHRNQPRATKGVRGVSDKVVRGRWATVPLRGITDRWAAGAMAVRLSLDRRGGSVALGRHGKLAPRLILVTVDDGAAATPGGVFAHYFPPFPVSFDNLPADRDYYARNYLTIGGESGKHRAYGGYLRDRPVGRAPMGGDWELADLRAEIRAAKAAGIDGFMVDILNFDGMNWDRTRDLLRAADREGGFTVMPTLDLAAPDIVSASPQVVGRNLARLLAHPSATTLSGKLAVGSFYAEQRSPAWWAEVMATLREVHGVSAHLLTVFLGPSPQLLKRYRAVSYGFGMWGPRTASGARSARNYARVAHAMGRRWIQPVAVQDARPKSGLYAEAGNTETMRAMWRRAVKDRADFVQIVTWNDYSESTGIAPSQAHGSVLLDITAHYARWFTTGREPAVTVDRVVLTHRRHPWAARATSGIMNMRPRLGGSRVRPRDSVEALVFLTAPARVTLTSGTDVAVADLSAGVTPILVDLGTGRPRVTVTRGGEVVASLVSPHEVTDRPLVQDLQYWASSS